MSPQVLIFSLNVSRPVTDIDKDVDISEALPPRLLVEKGVFTRDEFMEMVKMVDREMKRSQNEK